MLSSFTQREQISGKRFLIISYPKGFICKTLVTYPFIGWVSHPTFFYHIGKHWCDFSLWFLSTECVYKLQLLVHKTHFLDSFIIDWFHLPISCFYNFILKRINNLRELISGGHGYSVSLVFFRVKDCHVIVAGLVWLLHLTCETFRLIPDTFVFTFNESTVFLFLLVNGELHLVEGFCTWEVCWKTGNDGLSYVVSWVLITFMGA